MPPDDEKISILIVDDEPLLLDLIDDILKTQGYRVIPANSAEDALAMFDNGLTPDLIISDVNMPGMDGFEFYAQIQNRPGKNIIPFIFLSALYEKQIVAHGKELGADDYLMKPFTHEELLSSIKGVLTRSKKINESYYQQVSSTKDKILNMLSHEFRTPLMSILGFSKLLSEDTAQLTEPESKSFLDLIVQGSNRLYALVEDFIQSSSIETGECEKVYNATKQAEDINDLIERILKKYKTTEPEKEFTITKNIPNEPIYVLICSSQISTIIQKILDNATKFCYDKSSIEISVESKVDFVELSIKNYGDGVPPDEIDKIFDKFYQVNRKVQEQQSSGLGLFIAKGLATINKCTIELESVEKSHTIFKIKIPIAKQ
jgi:signal transduction histidine kinase